MPCIVLYDCRFGNPTTSETHLATRTLTFLMTDVQGSTRLWEGFPALMPGAIKRHEEILSDAVSGNGGQVIKSKGEGDSTFSVFESPSQAVQAAIAAQLGLAGETWPPGIALKVRMSIHMGEAEMREDDYFGPTINRCARIREVGHGGQILVSGVVHELVVEGDASPWKDHGIHRLRDLLRPEHVWQVQAPGLEASFPKLKSLSVLRNNLPVQLTSFIGRRNEVESVKLLMRQNRLINVVGFGGEGKTRLVLQLGAEIDEDPTTSVWFVALDSLRSAEEVSAAILSVLGGEAEDELSAESLKKCAVHSGATWLILDNAEHLIPIVRPIVDVLLRELPTLRILVSSREPLHVAGEVIYRIPGLSIPPLEDPSIQTVVDSEAAQLFLTRASARTSEFRLTATAAKAIGDICRLLNGVPLAIEQAASLVAIMSPSQILEKLQQRLDWLATEDPTAPERHRNIAATIQWSFELLTDDERKLFLMVGLFRDSFTAEAATYLAQLIVPSEAEAARLFRELVDKSLVTTNYDHESEVRFRLLEPLRQFAAANIGDAEDEWMSRYVDWYASFAQSADSELYGPNQVTWLEKCLAEEANLRKALSWCQNISDTRLLSLAYNLRKYWMRKGLFSEGRRWLRDSFSLATDQSDPLSATMANVLGAFATQQNDFTAALDYYRRAQVEFLASNDEHHLAAVYNNIAITLDGVGRLDEADEYYVRAVAVSRAGHDVEMLSFSLLNRSITQRKLGQLFLAEASAFEALALAEESQDNGRVAMIRSSLCGIAIDQEQIEEAAAHAVEALRIWRQEPNPVHLAVLLLKVAKVALAEMEAEAAAQLVSGAGTLLESSGSGNEPDSLMAKELILTEILRRFPSSSVHRWTSLGRTLSHDQLVILALEVCQKKCSSGNIPSTNTSDP